MAEEVHLVEEQVLGLQRVAVGDVQRRPPELDGSSCRRDITVGGVEHAIMGTREGAFGRCSRPVGQEFSASSCGYAADEEEDPEYEDHDAEAPRRSDAVWAPHRSAS